MRADGTHHFIGVDAAYGMFISYRAVSREEYWTLFALGRLPRAKGVDDDGLAPGEDPRHALTICGLAPDGWHPREGPMEIAFPREHVFTQKPMTYVVAKARGADWPHAMKPGEWRPLSG